MIIGSLDFVVLLCPYCLLYAPPWLSVSGEDRYMDLSRRRDEALNSASWNGVLISAGEYFGIEANICIRTQL